MEAPLNRADAAGARSRRWLWVALQVASLVLGLALAGFLYVATTYTLEPGPTGNFVGSTECRAGSTVEYRYAWRQGETIKFAVSFGNPGSHTVTITNVRLTPYPVLPGSLGVVGLTMSQSGPDEAREMPFRPVVLKPNDYFIARVELSTPDIFSENSRLFFDKLFLDYTVLGVDRSEYVSMGSYVGIQSTQPPNCH